MSVVANSGQLTAHRVSVVRGRKPVLREVSLALALGEVVGILGANGAGKSTLLGALAGEVPLQAGSVWLGAEPITTMPASTQARHRAVLPQKPSLQFDLSVTEVVTMGAYPFPEVSPASVNAWVQLALDHADVSALRERSYLALSGGEQQRVQFARVLVQVWAAQDTKQGSAGCYLLLDEPTSSLDPKHQQSILRVAAEIAHAEAVGVLVVLHDLNLAARWCDRLVLLHQGGVYASGPPAQVLCPGTLQAVYDVHVEVVTDPTCAGRPRIWFV